MINRKTGNKIKYFYFFILPFGILLSGCAEDVKTSNTTGNLEDDNQFKNTSVSNYQVTDSSANTLLAVQPSIWGHFKGIAYTPINTSVITKENLLLSHRLQSGYYVTVNLSNITQKSLKDRVSIKLYNSNNKLLKICKTPEFELPPDRLISMPCKYTPKQMISESEIAHDNRPKTVVYPTENNSYAYIGEGYNTKAYYQLYVDDQLVMRGKLQVATNISLKKKLHKRRNLQQLVNYTSIKPKNISYLQNDRYSL